MKQKFLHFSLTVIAIITISSDMYAQTNWSITGNGNIDASTNFLGTTNKKPIIFKTKNVERMRLLDNGNLGIGIADPKSSLQIVGNGVVTLSAHGLFLLGNHNKPNIAMDASNIQARDNGSAAALYLNYQGGSVYAGSYVTSTYGLVGAGLYQGLYGYTYAASGIGAYGWSASYYGVYGYTGGGSGSGDPNGISGVYGYNNSTGYGVGGYCNSGSGLYGYSENYIGLWARGNPGWYAGYFLGSVYTTGSYLPSDSKLKQNVKDVSSAMDIINQLHPKKYEYRQDGNFGKMNLPKGERFGLIADEVEKVLPNLVKQTEFNTRDAEPSALVDATNRPAKTAEIKNETIDFKAVNYTELIPVIIKGMQEQQSLIKNQQNIIDKQQQEINELKDLVKNTIAANVSDGKTGNNTGAYLIQNAPNPFSAATTVKCFIPASAKHAQLHIYNMDGKLIKSYALTTGMNNVNVNAGSLAAGQYSYSLLVDGKKLDSKSMTITK